ncbi:MAG: xanthine dehydrogenase family protein molybdopterin-binding subunit [Bacteroidota bacterium]
MTNLPKSNRRQFLKAGALLGTGLVISFVVPARITKFGESAEPDPVASFAPNAYLSIGSDGGINVLLSHVEMGQGIWTTLTMLIADELDADWKNIHVHHAPPGQPYMHTLYGLQITGGSSSTWSEFDRYRQAGATARMLLIAAGAKKFGVDPATCKTENGMVISGEQKASYGDLATLAASLPAPAKVELRPASDWKYIGKGLKRLDAPAKVNGTAKFGMDMQFPGMLTAVVAHSPVMGGTVKSFDATAAKAVPGVKAVVQIPTGVAVLADHFWAAKKGKAALKITWDAGANASFNSVTQMEKYRALAATKGLPALNKGNVESALAQGGKVIEASYEFPYLAHAPMEPMNCTVKLGADKCEIWTGTQLPGIDQAVAAKILGFKPEQVSIDTVFLGGGFGRRATPTSDFVAEAVHIAKASGKFIKMVWTREDDMQGGYYRAAFHHKLKIGVDNNGYPTAWNHSIVGQSIFEGTFLSMLVQNGIDSSSVEGIADSPYMTEVKDAYVGLHTTKLPISVLWYRSVGHTHTAFVMETIIDQLATEAGKDPLEFRRTLLKSHPRHLAALNLAAEKAGWGKALPAGHFHGIAVHESFLSFVGQVVEVSVTNGRVKVHKVTCAIDCGLAVNPDGVKAQMESGIIFGITMALYGEINFKDGKVQQTNFHNYPILRMNESPEIDVHIVASTEKMGGAGECGVPPTAPAIANAVFAATGKRIRKPPFASIT